MLTEHQIVRRMVEFTRAHQQRHDVALAIGHADKPRLRQPHRLLGHPYSCHDKAVILRDVYDGMGFTRSLFM